MDDSTVDISRAFLCRCGGPITPKPYSPEQNAIVLSCLACSKILSDEESFDIVKRSQQATMQLRKAREFQDAGDCTRAIEAAMSVLTLREALLYPLHRDLGVSLISIVSSPSDSIERA